MLALNLIFLFTKKGCVLTLTFVSTGCTIWFSLVGFHSPIILWLSFHLRLDIATSTVYLIIRPHITARPFRRIAGHHSSRSNKQEDFNWSVEATVQLAERRVGDRKVADPRFDSRTGNVSLCPWKDTLHLFPIRDTLSTCCRGPA